MEIKGVIIMRKELNEEMVMNWANIVGGIVNLLLFLVSLTLDNKLLAFVAFLGCIVQVIQYKKRKSTNLKGNS